MAVSRLFPQQHGRILCPIPALLVVRVEAYFLRIAGMLSGLLFTMGYIIYFKGVFIAPLAPNTPENWWLGISPEGIGTLGALLNFAVAIGVSRMTPPPPPAVRELVERIRVPT